MRGKDAFSEYHPIVNFLFFGIVFGFSMLTVHPVCILISFLSGTCYLIRLQGAKAKGLLLKGVLPIWLLTVLINPTFSHAGEMILCYLPTGNPLTLESILYGIDAGFMLASVLIWFGCFSIVMTSDKFLSLFGRLIPAISLVFTMTLRFVPKFIKQFDTVREAQRTLGHDVSTGNLLCRVKNLIVCFSIVVTWSLENGIETSGSMKSRGYGTKRRSAYSVYRWTERDKTALCFLIGCGVFFAAGGLSGSLSWRFYPNIRGALTDPLTLILEITYCLFCFLPILIDRKEEAAWKRFRSNI